MATKALKEAIYSQMVSREQEDFSAESGNARKKACGAERQRRTVEIEVAAIEQQTAQGRNELKLKITFFKHASALLSILADMLKAWSTPTNQDSQLPHILTNT